MAKIDKKEIEEEEKEQKENSSEQKGGVVSLTTLAARLQYQGGNALGRINQQKLNSLRAALKNDYNSRLIKTPLHTS